MTQAMQLELEDFLRHVKVFHKVTLSPNCRVIVGNLYNNNIPYVDLKRSKFLVLVLIDDESGKWFVMRLKAWRKLVKFMARKKLMRARHLTWMERWFGQPSQAEVDDK